MERGREKWEARQKFGKGKNGKGEGKGGKGKGKKGGKGGKGDRGRGTNELSSTARGAW